MRQITDPKIVRAATELKNNVAFAELIGYLADAALDRIKCSDVGEVEVREAAYRDYRAVKDFEATVRAVAADKAQ